MICKYSDGPGHVTFGYVPGVGLWFNYPRNYVVAAGFDCARALWSALGRDPKYYDARDEAEFEEYWAEVKARALEELAA